MNAPTYHWAGNKVSAVIDGCEVGRITVPDIQLHFGNGIYIRVAGISAVSTDASARRKGLASGMMREVNEYALNNGYSCSAVSTGLTNIARRLYCNSGNVHLFHQHTLALPISALPRITSKCDAQIRPYSSEDQAEVLTLIKKLEKPYFGTHRKTMDFFGNLRAGYRADSPELIAFVAVRDSHIIGFCDRFHFWSGMECELFIDSTECSEHCRIAQSSFAKNVADALLYHLAQTLMDAGEDQMRFNISGCRAELYNYLYMLGFRPESGHTFQFNILHFQRFIDELSPLLLSRIEDSNLSELPAQISFNYGEQSAILATQGQAKPVEISASRDVMTRVLCGTMSVWEAYLRADLAIMPRPTDATAQILQALLPDVAYQHPAVDRW